jgi:hypothetical protein
MYHACKYLLAMNAMKNKSSQHFCNCGFTIACLFSYVVHFILNYVLFPYFLVFGATENDGQIENIFILTRKAYLIFRKLFMFLNIVNHFLSLSFSFLLAFSLIVFSLPLNSL